MHARFWAARAPAFDWLARPAHYCDVLAPSVATNRAALDMLSATLRDGVPRGWTIALSRLPAPVAPHMTRPGLDWEKDWADLPRTLLHGDAKVSNFAIHAGGQVSAFDWAMAGTGPCAIDLGWYLAVNASRLTAPKEQIVNRYRTLLESALGHLLPEPVWRRLETVAIVCGERMLLWSKALALDAGRTGAREEWTWWVDRLAAIPA